MTKDRYENPLDGLATRFVQEICSFCECEREVLKRSGVGVCRDCVDKGSPFSNVQTGKKEPAKICSFCSMRESENQAKTLLDKVKRQFVPGTEFQLIHREFSICNACVRKCKEHFARREEARVIFQKAQGPECGPERCIEHNCKKLRIKLALRCLEHQFNQFH